MRRVTASTTGCSAGDGVVSGMAFFVTKLHLLMVTRKGQLVGKPSYQAGTN
jgi:hypothetical protein